MRWHFKGDDDQLDYFLTIDDDGSRTGMLKDLIERDTDAHDQPKGWKYKSTQSSGQRDVPDALASASDTNGSQPSVLSAPHADSGTVADPWTLPSSSDTSAPASWPKPPVPATMTSSADEGATASSKAPPPAF